MNTELKEALETLEVKLQDANSVEVKKAIEAHKADVTKALEAKYKEYQEADEERYTELKQSYEKAEVEAKALEQRLNEMETKLTKNKRFENGDNLPDFRSEFKNLLQEQHQDIKKLSKGNSKSYELKDVEIKAVGNMLLSANLTGERS